MSAKLMGLCYNLQIKRGQREVLLALADHANDDGFCWPSIGLVAWKTGYSERQVQRLIRQLELLEIVSIEDGATGGRNITPTYQLNLDILHSRTRPDLQKTPRERLGKGDKMSPFRGQVTDECREMDTGGTPDAAKGDIFDQKGDVTDQMGDILFRKGDAIVSPEPSVRTITEPSEENQQITDSDSLRSSGASLRSDADTQIDPKEQERRTLERVENAKAEYKKWSRPAARQLRINLALGDDPQARADFEAWLRSQEQSGAIAKVADA